jgi:LDH2 family malate/lactate/ureidoglycolate dehydrogenase
VAISAASLTSLAHRCLEAVGVAADDARAVAEVLVDANLRGHDSHGIARLPAYLRRVAAGSVQPVVRLREVARAGGMRRLDAGAALGPAAATKATTLAIELAREHGMALVALGNSSHFGSAGYYARRAAEADLIALVTTNGPANMAPYGSAEPFLGTNAIAVGVPIGSGRQLVLDMSSSVAARGAIMRAGALGEPIEPGLAIDADGNPTQDPVAALAGAVLPAGGVKGSGLALVACLWAGLLAGAGFDDEVGRMHGDRDGPQNLGQLFVCIDPWRLGDRESAMRRTKGLIDRLHALRAAPGFDAVLYPGERGERERAARLATGIPVATVEIEAIADACDELGLLELGAEAAALAETPR